MNGRNVYNLELKQDSNQAFRRSITIVICMGPSQMNGDWMNGIGMYIPSTRSGSDKPIAVRG